MSPAGTLSVTNWSMPRCSSSQNGDNANAAGAAEASAHVQKLQAQLADVLQQLEKAKRVFARSAISESLSMITARTIIYIYFKYKI